MTTKVRNGTAPSERLCDTCSHAHIFQGEGQREYIRCLADYDESITIPTRVVRCNRYTDKRNQTPSLHEMAEMAFILTESSGSMKQAGFVHARHWKKAHKDDDILPAGVREF